MRRSFYTLLIALLSISYTSAQIAYVLPSPTDAAAEMTLFIDISQSQDGTQNNALKAILTDHPDDPVYLWTWQPAGPDGVGGNGNWDASNPNMVMTKETDLLYSITFIPEEFYAVDGSQFFASGISCLAKLEDGNAYSDEGYNGEAKTEDLMVEIIPKLCDGIFCIFPEIKEQDDFISITYDNNQETNADLQNMGDDECYVYMSAKTGLFTLYPYADAEMVTSTPELKMEPLVGEPGKFRLTFVPEDYWADIPEDEDISEILFYILRPGVTITIPTFENMPVLVCPE